MIFLRWCEIGLVCDLRMAGFGQYRDPDTGPFPLGPDLVVPLESDQIHGASKSISVTFERHNLVLERRGPAGRKEGEDHAEASNRCSKCPSSSGH
jgi:hypothetical protein